jgi:hypothetical protein
MAGNALYMNVSRPAMQAAGYVTDTTAPQLTSFDLDVSEVSARIGGHTARSRFSGSFANEPLRRAVGGCGRVPNHSPHVSRCTTHTMVG